MALVPRTITARVSDFTDTIGELTITARLVGAFGRGPSRGPTAEGGFFSVSRQHFKSVGGSVDLILVPTDQIDPSGLRWRLEWPTMSAPLDFELPSGGDIPLHNITNPTAYVWAAVSGVDPVAISPGASSGRAAGTQQITTPVFVDDSYLFIAQPVITRDLIGITIDDHPQLGGFTKSAATFEVAGRAYEFWRSNRQILVSVFSNHSLILHRNP